MGKIIKNSIIVSIMMFTAIAGITVASAKAQNIQTTLSLSHDSNWSGPVRDYTENNYSFTIVPTHLEDGNLNPGYVKLGVQLYKQNYVVGIPTSTELKYNGSMYIDAPSGVGNVYALQLGNCGAGKRYFRFSTDGDWGNSYGAIDGNAIIANW